MRFLLALLFRKITGSINKLWEDSPGLIIALLLIGLIILSGSSFYFLDKSWLSIALLFIAMLIWGFAVPFFIQFDNTKEKDELDERKNWRGW